MSACEVTMFVNPPMFVFPTPHTSGANPVSAHGLAPLSVTFAIFGFRIILISNWHPFCEKQKLSKFKYITTNIASDFKPVNSFNCNEQKLKGG